MVIDLSCCTITSGFPSHVTGNRLMTKKAVHTVPVFRTLCFYFLWCTAASPAALIIPVPDNPSAPPPPPRPHHRLSADIPPLRQLCVILEPMQELMTRHKAYSLSPRDCLKTTLFQKWQRMVAPPGG